MFHLNRTMCFLKVIVGLYDLLALERSLSMEEKLSVALIYWYFMFLREHFM